MGGVENLSDMLNSQSASEAIRAEAAGVVAQITSPCLDQYQHLAGFLENMEDLVKSLTSKIAISLWHFKFIIYVGQLWYGTLCLKYS